MELVKEGRPNELGFRHIGMMDMHKTLARPAFETMGEPVNDERFNLSDKFDKSTYLSKMMRARSVIPFQKSGRREETLIAKGGDTLIRLGGKPEVFYDQGAKLR